MTPLFCARNTSPGPLRLSGRLAEDDDDDEVVPLPPVPRPKLLSFYEAKHVLASVDNPPFAQGSFGSVYSVPSANTEEFRRESEIAWRWNTCECPNIVRVLAVCDSPYHECLVMEMMHETLAAVIQRRGTVSRPRALRTLADVARGLQWLQDSGFAHRDVKPDNVLLDQFGTAKVADLGACCRVGAEGTAFEDMPSPLYQPPEVLSQRLYSPFSDVFSFAVVAYELLVGAPYGEIGIYQYSLSKTSVALALLQDHVVRDRQTLDASALGDGIGGLLQRCWSWERTTRPTFGQVVAELCAELSSCFSP
eukprot:m51a1_g3051 putative tkl protein kinase (307) ;mRNA; f:952799-953816